MPVGYSQRIQTAGFYQDTDTQSWQSPVSSSERHKWERLYTHLCWTPDSFLEAPRKNCTKKKKITSVKMRFTDCDKILSFSSLTCCMQVGHPCGGHSLGKLPGYWIQQAWYPIGRSGYHCRGSSFLLRTGCTPGQTSPGTPQLCMRMLGDTKKNWAISKSFLSPFHPQILFNSDTPRPTKADKQRCKSLLHNSDGGA